MLHLCSSVPSSSANKLHEKSENDTIGTNRKIQILLIIVAMIFLVHYLTTSSEQITHSMSITGWRRALGDGDQQGIDFLHIPKCGGTSVIEDLYTFGLFATTGHDELAWNDPKIEHSHRVFTMFRQPRQHLVSMWRHCHDGRHKRKQFQIVPFGSWLHYWSDFDRRFNGSFERYNLKHYQYRDRPDYTPFQCNYIPVNLQSTRVGVFDESAAQKRVNEMFAVGIQDMYRESLCVLAFKANGNVAPECLCSGTFEGTHKVHGVSRYDPEDYLKEAVQEDLVSLTRMDQIVYDAAKQRLIAEIQQIQSEFDTQFLCPLNGSNS